MTGEAGASHARDVPPDRRGRVGEEERHRLRGSFGFALYTARSARGWSLELLAVRSGVSESTVRRLEQGRQRPSDVVCTRLARALRYGHDEVAVAVCDVQLRRAAGTSLRPWVRRHGPRSAAAKVYAAALVEAQRQVDAGEAEPLCGPDPSATVFLAMFDTAWAEAAATSPPSPADAHPDRWPRVKTR